MQFSNHEAKLISSFPRPGCNSIESLYFLGRKQKAATQKSDTSSFRLSFRLAFVRSCTETHRHKLGLKTSSDVSGGLSNGCNAAALSAPFPRSPVLHASWSLLLPGLFISCCSWLNLTFHFSRLALYDGAFPFLLPVVAAGPVVHSGPWQFPFAKETKATSVPGWGYPAVSALKCKLISIR